jgi:hypothetical protein
MYNEQNVHRVHQVHPGDERIIGFGFGAPFIGGVLGGLLGSAIIGPQGYPYPYPPYPYYGAYGYPPYGYPYYYGY